MRLSKNKLKYFENIYRELLEAGKDYVKIKYGVDSDVTIDEECVGDGGVYVTYDIYQYREWDTRSVLVPNEFLFDENGREMLRQQLWEENIRAVEEKKKRDEAERLAKEKKQLELEFDKYLKLKRKFEPETDKIIDNFFTNLAANQQPLGTEFQQVLDENYWDLLQK